MRERVLLCFRPFQATAMRWEALQKRLEVVQQRRRDRAKETSRRMQAADRHTQARERRKVRGWCSSPVLSEMVSVMSC